MNRDGERKLGLTFGDKIAVFVIFLVSAGIAAGGWFAGRFSEADLPSRESVIIKVNINTAGQAELTLLPGIGKKTARLIIKERETRGPFKTIQDLERVRGIGPSSIERIVPYAAYR